MPGVFNIFTSNAFIGNSPPPGVTQPGFSFMITPTALTALAWFPIGDLTHPLPDPLAAHPPFSISCNYGDGHSASVSGITLLQLYGTGHPPSGTGYSPPELNHVYPYPGPNIGVDFLDFEFSWAVRDAIGTQWSGSFNIRVVRHPPPSGGIPAALRLGQRNDGGGPSGHARLAQVQSKQANIAARVGGKNTLI